IGQIYIVNTCAVTQTAVNTSWKAIKRLIKQKFNNEHSGSDFKIIVTGCLATLQRDKMMQTKGIDLVLTQQDKSMLLNCAQFAKSTRARPIVKIQDGCQNECSFCIARLIRGKAKSVRPEVVLEEIKAITSLGYQEIVLTGLNLGQYGCDFGFSLEKLLRLIPDDTFRIRLSSLQPEAVTDDLLDLWQNKKLCRHLHIPLQSGDDNILKLMRRKHSVDDYRRIIDKIINKIPGVNIGADIIVGFPFEDDKAFNNTVKLIEELPFGYLHIFPYSKRPLTPAEKLPETVHSEEKKSRMRILKEIDKKKRRAFLNQFIGSKMEVLVESNNKGLTDNYLNVRLTEDNCPPGRLCEIVLDFNHIS
ncbi:MAG: MiaB/RimO family radical SAM methylthiotransferase, partial [candidate division WOR-3 bacterium]|nr:MiaB/RimO family radical SAM methylthiotransferase [candidate division WOR-3 bacterium]